MLIVKQRGVTLVELIIGIAIVAVAIATGMPSFVSLLQSAQNRAAAESVLNGLQLARNEAVKRNTIVRFNLTDGTGRVTWSVGCVNVTAECPATIQIRRAEESAVNARVGISRDDIPMPTPAGHFGTAISAGSGLDAGVSFNGMGQPVNGVEDIQRIDVTNAASEDARRYVVVIGKGGNARMCDPALALASNPQGCS